MRKPKKIGAVLGSLICLAFLAFSYSESNIVEPIQNLIAAQGTSAYTAQVVPPTLVSSPTCKVTKSSDCWVATAKSGYKFKAKSLMYLPTVGSSGGGSGSPSGSVNQSFYNDMVTHETWHRNIYKAYVASVYGALESWSAGYSSAGFATSGEAKSAFDSDMAAALALAHTFDSLYSAQQNTHPNPGASVQGGVWVARNPNWGATALGVVQGFQPAFQTSSGNCP